MGRQLIGDLRIAKADVFALTGHQNPKSSFFGPEWCLLSPEDLYVQGIFDRGTHEGYWVGVVCYFEDGEPVISVCLTDRWEHRRFFLDVKCEIPLKARMRVYIHVGKKDGKDAGYIQLAPWREPSFRDVPR